MENQNKYYIFVASKSVKLLKLKAMKNATFTSAKMSLIFRMAHRQAKSFTGHYQARMSMGLSVAYKHFAALSFAELIEEVIFNNINEFGQKVVRIKTEPNGFTICRDIEHVKEVIGDLTKKYGEGLLFRTHTLSNEFHFINTRFQASLKNQLRGLNSDMYKSNRQQAGRNAMTYRTTSL